MKRGLPYRSLSFQLFLLTFLFQYLDIGAQIIYVGPDETYTNIKWALGQAKDGDTIIVKDGVYVEDIKVRVSVVLMAENVHGAVIGDGSATLAMISMAQAPTDGVVIDGFKFADYDRPGIIVGDGNPANGVKNCVIRNNYMENRRLGIRVAANSTNLEISGNTITGSNQHGIQHQGVGDNQISGNVLEDCGESGIFLPEQHVGSVTISNNEIRRNGRSGIGIERSDVVMEGNIIDGNQIGINTNCGRSGIVVRDSNQVINNTEGIVIECGTSATIENNIISGNLEIGVINHGFTSITGNTIDGNSGYGILLQTGSSEIRNNHIGSNGIHGIEVGFEMEDVEIMENNISENNQSGIMQSSTATIDGNTINRNSEWGIFMQLGSSAITNNQINSNGIHGIEVGLDTQSTVISDNEISGNKQVGVLTFSGAVLTGNFIDGNGAEGILTVSEAGDVEIRDGNIISNNAGHEILVEMASSVLIRQNTIESDSSRFDESGGFCGIYIAGTATVDNNIIQHINGHGIYVGETAEDVVITGRNQIRNNRKGIFLTGPAIIKNNIISDNLEHGIMIEEPAEQVSLTWNRMENNYTGVTILPGTSGVELEHNSIINNVRGVFSAGEPRLRENTIQNNTEYGIKVRVEGIDLGGRMEADSGMNAILDNGWNVINEDSAEIRAIGNYWGTSDPAAIDSTILDNEEDSLAGPVIFKPFLTEYNVGVEKEPYPGEQPDSNGMLTVYPNPVHGNATIQFRLLAAGEVDLRIISASGRIIQSLVSCRYYEPGEHRIQWDGFPGEGRMAPDGIYFVVMKAGQKVLSRKLLLVR